MNKFIVWTEVLYQMKLLHLIIFFFWGGGEEVPHVLVFLPPWKQLIVIAVLTVIFSVTLLPCKTHSEELEMPQCF